MNAYPDIEPIDVTENEWYWTIVPALENSSVIPNVTTVPEAISPAYRIETSSGAIIRQAFVTFASRGKYEMRWRRFSGVYPTCEAIPPFPVPGSWQEAINHKNAQSSGIWLINNVFYNASAGVYQPSLYALTGVWPADPAGSLDDYNLAYAGYNPPQGWDMTNIPEIWHPAILNNPGSGTLKHTPAPFNAYSASLYSEECDPRAQKMFTYSASVEISQIVYDWYEIAEPLEPKALPSLLPQLTALALLGSLCLQGVGIMGGTAARPPKPKKKLT